MGQQIHLNRKRHLFQERDLGQATRGRIGFLIEIQGQLDVGERLPEGEPERHVGEVVLGEADAVTIAREHDRMTADPETVSSWWPSTSM